MLLNPWHENRFSFSAFAIKIDSVILVRCAACANMHVTGNLVPLFKELGCGDIGPDRFAPACCSIEPSVI
jgi:hypothetical protein